MNSGEFNPNLDPCMQQFIEKVMDPLLEKMWIK